MTAGHDSEHERNGGRRASDEVGGYLAKKVVAWVIVIGLGLSFTAGVWAMDVRGRLGELERDQFTREEAQQLRSSVDLLRLEIGYLRRDLTDQTQRRQSSP